MPTSTNITNLKINELTEAQYDAAVQGGIIGANELSILTETDSEYATINIPSTMPELTVVGWSNNTQTVTVTGVTATNTVFVSPAPASASDYSSAGIICTAQGTDSLTFTCTTVPANAITVNVVIME